MGSRGAAKGPSSGRDDPRARHEALALVSVGSAKRTAAHLPFDKAACIATIREVPRAEIREHSATTGDGVTGLVAWLASLRTRPAAPP
ncbi:MAG: hypothetical protein KF850_29690 [Labilithrix sp.]|nr:hypothetical protein [Labilithrix sp.]MBX3216249.1 hypothetical protein [Labilithrix sp.]